MKLTKTAVKQTLAECAFDPTLPAFRVILDLGNDNYFLLKAIELLSETARSPKIDNTKQAMQLLTMYRAATNGTKKLKTARKARDNSTGQDSQGTSV